MTFTRSRSFIWRSKARLCALYSDALIPEEHNFNTRYSSIVTLNNRRLRALGSSRIGITETISLVAGRFQHSFQPVYSPYHLTVPARCQDISENISPTLPAGCIICSMDAELIRKVRAELARQGGLARAKALTSKQRRESAIKASKAAAKARTRAAKERKTQKGSGG